MIFSKTELSSKIWDRWSLWNTALKNKVFWFWSVSYFIAIDKTLGVLCVVLKQRLHDEYFSHILLFIHPVSEWTIWTFWPSAAFQFKRNSHLVLRKIKQLYKLYYSLFSHMPIDSSCKFVHSTIINSNSNNSTQAQ